MFGFRKKIEKQKTVSGTVVVCKETDLPAQEDIEEQDGQEEEDTDVSE